ncbi:hypothetical protein [Flagellimonas sp. CMM7]|uniref:hypothetical protein n=1 Tax=Flagellimonas sp. CMM7 TaxID=2654676 RepID=UPI0013D423EA|nr:hypothetical protein [Flagellimonas sp. CMM7]UII79578.1 hypothetical protein LV704_18195 [Flagellimonas sp. CMM7]
MNTYLITPYQKKPYLLKVPKAITMIAFESALYNKHKNYYDSHLLSTMPEMELDDKGIFKESK